MSKIKSIFSILKSEKFFSFFAIIFLLQYYNLFFFLKSIFIALINPQAVGRNSLVHFRLNYFLENILQSKSSKISRQLLITSSLKDPQNYAWHIKAARRFLKFEQSLNPYNGDVINKDNSNYSTFATF